MSYVCKKVVRLNGQEYYPGEVIPENEVLPERVRALKWSGYLVDTKETAGIQEGLENLFSQEEVDRKVSEAVQEALAGINQEEPEVFGGNVPIPIKGENEELVLFLMTPEEISTAVQILQMNAEEGVKAVSDVASENALIMLHAIDSRKTIKEAAKKQADLLFTEAQAKP